MVFLLFNLSGKVEKKTDSALYQLFKKALQQKDSASHNYPHRARQAGRLAYPGIRAEGFFLRLIFPSQHGNNQAMFYSPSIFSEGAQTQFYLFAIQLTLVICLL